MKPQIASKAGWCLSFSGSIAPLKIGRYRGLDDEFVTTRTRQFVGAEVDVVGACGGVSTVAAGGIAAIAGVAEGVTFAIAIAVAFVAAVAAAAAVGCEL